MAELHKVSWRTAGYAALGSVVAVASVVVIIRSDGVHPTSLTSSAATRWLVHQASKEVVLVDGLAGRVVARIDAESDASGEVAVQGDGGAFLVAPTQGSVRTISTAKLQLGTAQPVASLSEEGAKLGVGASGLTVVNSKTSEANVVAVDDIARPITVPDSLSSRVAADGSMWLFTDIEATHLNVDESGRSMPLRGRLDQTTTVGAHAVAFDSGARTVRWLDGGDVPVTSIANVADAVLQEAGDDAPCVWLGAGDTLACVGATGIDHTIVIDGMNLQVGDRLAIAGTAAVVVRVNNEIDRLDLEGRKLPGESRPSVRPDAPPLAITAANDLIWIDDQSGDNAWVVHRFGINTITKNDSSAPLLDPQGQVKTSGTGGSGPAGAGGIAPGDDADANRLDGNDQDDPPNAIDDSVTARSGNTVTIPVTFNDYDPDGDAIAALDVQPAGHGTTNVLDGTSVAYMPEPGFSGTDSFQYTIVDEHGKQDSANVSVQLFPADSANRPPIARPDRVKTRVGRPITIDVLANDIDPERDILSVPTFRQNGTARITDTTGPTGLQALRYEPPPGRSGIFTFTYQAADPQGGTSQKTTVTVDVSGDNAPNEEPVANPDAIRLPVGITDTLDVRANDADNDGDELTIEVVSRPRGVDVQLRSQQLEITLLPGAADRSVILYSLNDGMPGHEQTGRVLVLRIGDTALNRSPVANPDADRVVIGTSVTIPVTANDIDPDLDIIRLLTVDKPDDGVGTTSVEGNSVRFIPNLPDITEPTPVTFTYRIGDGNGHEAIGHVSVTVLVKALPIAPFARDDFADTVRDTPVNIDVLANDSDPSGGQPNLDGPPSCPGGGTASLTADERVTFDPPDGAVGTFRCKYNVTNTQGLGAEASIIVTVTVAPPDNNEPTLNSAAMQKTINIGDSFLFRANDLASDTDGDGLVFASVGTPIAGSHTFLQQSDSFVYVAPRIGSSESIPGAVGLDVTISDGRDGNVRGTISIRIVDNAAIPSTPPTTREISRPASVGDTVSVDVLAALNDQNIGTDLSLQSATLDAGSPDASVVFSGGIVVITPAAAGIVSVTYVVADSDGLTQSGKIRVTVAPPPPDNPPPVAVDDDLNVASGGINDVDILANDEGITDPGDRVTVQIVARPPATFGAAVLSNGVVTFAAAPDAAGVEFIRYLLNDGNGPASTGTITVTILPCSESAPSVRSASVFTPYQTPIDIDLTQYVTSGGVRPGSISGAGLTATTGRYTPPAGMNGAETVTYTVENGCQQTAQGTLTIDVNRVPVGGTIDRNLSRGVTLTLAVS
ncbi:MAG: Ig-like domain-containing protein, partial [Actinomycetota bacterium]|nr:Ig-like domain-containing protein [Actinomycetota bacterium]